jgi:O-acetyl-ADP-ribose deacetylase (regulator of RNase III)
MDGEAILLDSVKLHRHNVAVIFAVVPPWTGHEGDFFYEAYCAAIEHAVKRRMSSIALTIPDDFPSSEVSRNLSEAIQESGGQIKEYLFIGASDPVVKTLTSTVQLLLTSNKPNKGSVQGYSKTSDPCVLTTPEGIQVKLVKGSLAKQKVDVIVNTVGSDCDLSKGAVSNTILSEAGKEMQTECQSKMAGKQTVEYGHVIDTDGYKLKCKTVLHAACQRWNDATKDESVLRKIVKTCLNIATTKAMKSIAFPAIGSGNLGVPRDVVCRVLYDEVLTFSRRTNRTSLEDIIFVVYDRDIAIYKAFEARISELVGDEVKVNVTQRHSTIGRKLRDSMDGGPMSLPCVSTYTMRSDVEREKRIPSKLVFRIYGKTRDLLEKVKEEIESIGKEGITDALLDKPDQQKLIAQLTTEQIERIESDGSKHRVRVKVFRGRRTNRIQLQGESGDITSVMATIYQIFNEIQHSNRPDAHWEYEVDDGGSY